ncbi:hypothetical protein SAMN05660477_01851 [Soonwooa buanensis]|uniref:Lipoprotein n=1 Tax=Soonwooa buanensis TaxID=619805 RepID=A0A1T5F7C3_9FLAO|nr:hypothetical protein [Soonwooa buanensis]SKB91928.1 hypothetical protein SAMN05660477_01851 [Soonwooa buanensis]
MKIFTTIAIGLSLMSCNGTSSMHAQKGKTMQKVEYTEERRLNKDFDSKEIFALSTMDEVTNLYGKLQDPQFKRSAPIPIIEAGESLLVVKPKASSATDYSDIEIESIQKDEKNIIVKYKKIENWEYKEAKQTHPVLILKIESSPKNLILEKIK